MPQFFVETDRQQRELLVYISSSKRPFTAEIKRGHKRTLDQNRLQRLWMNEIAEQLDEYTGMTAEEWRGYCKLNIGVPILVYEDEEFRAAYDLDIAPLCYEHKLRLMQLPHDYGVTRKMNTKQMKRYLDNIVLHFGEQGVSLTQPDEGLMESLANEPDYIHS